MNYYRLLRAIMYGRNDTMTAPVKGSSKKDRPHSIARTEGVRTKKIPVVRER